MARGLDIRVLDDINAWSLAGFWVGILCMGPIHWIRGWGLAYGIYPWGALVMGDLMGRYFGWVVDFFLGGSGEGKRNSRARLPRRFRRRREFQTALYICLLYIIYGAVEVSLQHVKGHHERWPRSSMPWADTCSVRASTTRRPSPLIEDGEGVAAPRSTTDSTE